MTQSTVRIADVKIRRGDPPATWVNYALIDGNGARHSTFDAKLGAFLETNKGALVDIETEQTAKGSNLKSARIHAETVTGAANGGTRDTLIVREVALKAAVEWASSAREPASWNDVLLAAAKFAEWITASDEEPGEQEPA